jgi:O-antigen/teichoic acid export membrane protein
MTTDEQVRGDSRFVFNAAALGTSTVVTTVLTLVQVKVLAVFLSPDMFGLFAALRGFSLLIALVATNGLPQLLVRFLPYHESRGHLTSAITLSGACFLGPLFLLSVFVFVVEHGRSLFFGFVPADALNAGLLLWFYATTLGLALKFALYGGLNGLRRLSVQVILEMISLGVQVGWIFMWRNRLDLTALFMIMGAVSLATCAAGIPWYFIRLAKDTAPATGEQRADRSDVLPAVEYRRYWYGATGLSLVAIAFTDVDRYLLSQVLTLELLSLFHIGSRILRFANRFLSVPVLAFQPEVTRCAAEGRGGAIEASTRVFIKVNIALSVFVVFVLLTAAPEVVRVVANIQYQGAVPLLMILAVSIPFSSTTAPLTAVMKAVDQVRHALYCDLSWAITYVVLLLLLGGSYGLIGAGLAHLAASLVQVSMAVSLSRVGLKGRFFAVVFGKAAACGLVAFGPVLLANAFFAGVPYGIAVKTALLLAALVVFRFMVRAVSVFTGEERGNLTEMLTKSGLGFLGRRLF